MAKTILEEVLEKYPKLTEEDFAPVCPPMYGYPFPKSHMNDDGKLECDIDCPECWNREVEDDRT